VADVERLADVAGAAAARAQRVLAVHLGRGAGVEGMRRRGQRQEPEQRGQEREKRRAATCALLWIPRDQTGGRLSAALGGLELASGAALRARKKRPGLEPAPFLPDSIISQ